MSTRKKPRGDDRDQAILSKERGKFVLRIILFTGIPLVLLLWALLTIRLMSDRTAG